MNDEIYRKQLLFRCWHRGTREMDIIMGKFAAAKLPDMNRALLDEMHEFMQESDIDIYNWISNKEAAPANVNHDLVEQLKQFYNLSVNYDSK